MKITRSQLRKMTKDEMFEWYHTHMNDATSYIFWNGLSKADWIENILGGRDELEFTSLTVKASEKGS